MTVDVKLALLRSDERSKLPTMMRLIRNPHIIVGETSRNEHVSVGRER